MKSKTKLLITLFGLFFAFIFYKQSIGLNLFLYNIVLLFLLTKVFNVFDFKNKLHSAVALGSLLTAIAVLLHASSFAITMNIFSLFFLFGIVNNKELKMLLNVAFSASCQFFTGVFHFFKIKNETQTRKRYKIGRWIVPIIILAAVFILFVTLYSASSSKFDSIFGFIGEFVHNTLNQLFQYIKITFILLFCFGFIISCAYFVKTGKVSMYKEPITDNYLRIRRFYRTKPTMKLLTEFRTAVIMFVMLNALLLVFNVVDIWHVWINFTWDGELLKEFVHEGTYTLIFTLMISVGLVLYYFRRNLNFFSKNKPLKILANIWLAQNMIMAISVLIRNIHYINYYNLAYLRIGVVLFVVIVFVGLVSVLIKINATRSFFYLFKVNMLFTYIVLVVFSLADWDVIIAKFNFSRSDKAFVHLNFMAKLSDKALPYLDQSELEMNNMKKSPVFEYIGWKHYFTTPDDYIKIINERKLQFLEEYTQRSWLEWNYADYRAYNTLKE